MRWSGLLSITMYFYSRPCGRGDYLALEAEATQIIISTHAPAGGATADTLFRELYAQHFYSRPCGRGDLARCIVNGESIISTHAPAGGATRRKHSIYLQRFNFYSRPCGRGDTG